MAHIHSLSTNHLQEKISEEMIEIYNREKFTVVEGNNCYFGKKQILFHEIEIILSQNRDKTISIEFFSTDETATIINFLRYIPSPLKMRVNNFIREYVHQ